MIAQSVSVTILGHEKSWCSDHQSHSLISSLRWKSATFTMVYLTRRLPRLQC